MTAFRGLPFALVDLSGIYHRKDPDAYPGAEDSEMRHHAHGVALDYLHSTCSQDSPLSIGWAGHSSLFFVTLRSGWS